MNNKHISNTTKAKSKGIIKYYRTKPNVSNTKKKNIFTEKALNALLKNVKTENVELSDSEDSASIAYKSIDDKNKKQQDEMCELASISYEKNVNISVSNLQELTDTELVDGKIVRIHTSSLSTALPMMKILSPKLGPHTCLECCYKCNKVFRLLDSPLHICRIRSINKQNEFLKIEPSLYVDSCLCHFCWKDLEKKYKSNKSKNKKEESYSEKKLRLLERFVKKNVSKNKNQTRRCSIHLCSQPYRHKMSVNDCENIKKLFLTFEFCRLVFVQSKKQTTDFLKFPFCLCEIHNAMILVMSTCQICGEKLNAPFITDEWSMHEMWNLVLIENNLPLTLKPGMFICVTCKEHISKTNPGFPTIDLPRLREYIITSNAVRLKLYGESQLNVVNVCQESTYVSFPIVVAKMEEEKECVRSTKVKFSDPLITTNCSIEIDYYKNDTESITSTALLNLAEQNLCTPKLEPKYEGLDFVELKEEYFKTFTRYKLEDQLFNFYSDPTLNTSDIKIANLNKSVDDTSKNILSQHNPSKNLTDYTHLNNHNKISKHEGINEYLGISNGNSLQNLCQVDNAEIDEIESEINSFCQIVSGYNEIKGNQSKLNYHDICSVAQNKSSMNFNESNKCMKEINTNLKTIYLNETDNSTYSFIAAVEPPNAIVNPISTKRKQSDVICDTISNKDVKKQRMNEKYSSYEINSTDDSTNKSYRSKNIANPSINSPNILNMTPNCKNKYDSNSDTSDSGCLLHSEMFSESDSEGSLPNYEKEETDFMIVMSNDLSSDSDFELEKKPDHTIEETDNTVVDLDFDLSLNSDRELKIKPDYKTEETDCIVVDSDSEFSLDSDCKLKIKPNHETEMDCTFVSDREKSLGGKIILNGENILENCTIHLDDVKDSNFEIVPDAETETDVDEQSHINISVTEEVFNNKKLSSFKIVSNVQEGSDHEILLIGDKVVETASWSEKGTIKYKIISDEIKLSGNKRSTCIIISDNEEEFKNKIFSTYKINLQKGSDSKILLDGEKVAIVSENENRTATYEIDPFNHKKSKCIIIFDNENEFINKKLYTFKIVSNDQEGSDCKMLLDGEKIYDIESENEKGKIKYVVVFQDEIESSGNKESQSTIIYDKKEKFNNKKSTFKILVRNVQKGSHTELLDGKKSREMFENENGKKKCMIASEKELNYKKVSDITIKSDGKIIVDDSRGLKTLDNINTISNDSQINIKYRHSFPCLEMNVNEHNDAKQDKIQESCKEFFSDTIKRLKTNHSKNVIPR